MRPLAACPPTVGGSVLGGSGSGVPPQLTTSLAVRQIDAGRSAGWLGTCGIVNTAALIRVGGTTSGFSVLLIGVGEPPRRSRIVSLGRRVVRDTRASRMRPVSAGMRSPGTQTGSPGAAGAMYVYVSTLSVPV